jgi:predicted secreted protein
MTDKAIAQVDEATLHEKPDPEQNSIAILMQHISGNSVSRWTNFRTEDGEKPWRNREQEFIDRDLTKDELIAVWEKGWGVLYEALQSIKEDELNDLIYIRNEGHTILEAAQKHLVHIAYHTGQIVYLCNMHAGEDWISLSIPKGKTEEYNRKKFGAGKSRGFYNDRLEDNDS